MGCFSWLFNRFKPQVSLGSHIIFQSESSDETIFRDGDSGLDSVYYSFNEDLQRTYI